MSLSPFNPLLGFAMPVDRSVGRDAYSDYWSEHGPEGANDFSRGGVLSDFFGSLMEPFTNAVLNSDRANYYRQWVQDHPELYQAIIDDEITTEKFLDLIEQEKNGSGAGAGALSSDTFQYLNAELAKFYGMDRNTAYQEALSNTAYQRAVKDMQSAGLNPASIFGSGRGSGAGGVAFIGTGNSASGSSSSNSKLFERDTYGMLAALAGLATAIATKRPQNFWLGQQSAQGIMQTMNVLDRKFSK